MTLEEHVLQILVRIAHRVVKERKEQEKRDKEEADKNAKDDAVNGYSTKGSQ